MGEKIDPATGLPYLDDNRPELNINQQLIDEIADNTSRRSLIEAFDRPAKMPQQVKQLTGGVDFDRVVETLGSGFNIEHAGVQDRLGKEQSALDKWGNFAVQVGAEVLGGSLEGMGYLGDWKGTADMLDGDMSTFGNWLSDIGVAMKEGSREHFPIFGAHDMGNLGYWLSNGVSVASSLSLMIPAVGTIRGVGALGKAFGLAGKIGKAPKAFKQGMSALGQAFLSRHMENNMEARGVYEETRDAALAGGKSLTEANLLASEAARNLYVTNYALMGQDFFQYRLLARGPKINADITSRRLAKTLGVNPAGVTAKQIYGIGADMASEGVEEGLQFIFAEEAKYRSLAKAGLVEESRLEDRLKNYSKNGEMWTSILFGALGAGVMQGGRKATDAMGITGKAEKAQLEARIAHAKEAHTASTAAAVKLQAAIQAGDGAAIEQAEREMVFNIAYNAAKVGNFDLAMATIDDLIASDPAEATAEGNDFAPDYKERLKKVKADMQEVGKLYSKNAKKYSNETVREITELQYNNRVFSRKLDANQTEESRQKAEFPMHNKLSSEGVQLFDAKAEKKGLERAIRSQKLRAAASKKGSINRERAEKRAEKWQEELDNVNELIKTLEEKRKESLKGKYKKGERKPASVRAAEQAAKKDKKIIAGLENNSDDLQKSISERLHMEALIEENNEDLKTMTSAKGQQAAADTLEELREQQRKAAADAKKAVDDAKKEAERQKKEDSVNNSVNEDDEDEAARLAAEKEGKRSKRIEQFTDEELDQKLAIPNLSTEARTILEEEKARRAKEKEEGRKKEANKKIAKGNQLIDSLDSEEIQTPSNDDRHEEKDKKIEESSGKELVAETGSAIAWKTTTGLTVIEVAEQVDGDKDNAIALSEFLEDTSIDKTQFKLVFFIDKAALRDSVNRAEGVDEHLKSLYAKLQKGETLTEEELGVLPVRAYIVNKKGERVKSKTGKDITTAMHNTTFQGWEKLSEEKRAAAKRETLQIKQKILTAALEGKEASADITEVRNGHLMNEKTGGKFAKNNVATTTGQDPSEMTMVVGDQAEKGSTSRYVTKEKDTIEEYDELDGYSSATPGAVYVVVKTANGSSFPLRLFVENINEVEANLIYQLYAKTYDNPNAYKENLSKHEDIQGLIQNSADPRVSELGNFIDLDKITIGELLKVLVYEGSQTQSSGPGRLYVSKGYVSIGDLSMDKKTFMSPKGKEQFIAKLQEKRKQISIGALNNPAYVSYLVNNEVVTTNATSVNGVMFRAPTTIFGEVEVSTPKAEPAAAATSTPASTSPTYESEIGGENYVLNIETKKVTNKETGTPVKPETANKVLVNYENRTGTLREVEYNGTLYYILSDDRIISSSTGAESYKNRTKAAQRVKAEILKQAGPVPTATAEVKEPVATVEQAPRRVANSQEEYDRIEKEETEKFLEDKETKEISMDKVIEDAKNDPSVTQTDIAILKYIREFWNGKILYQDNYDFNVPHPNIKEGSNDRWGGTFDLDSNSVFIFNSENLTVDYIIHEALHGLMQTKLEKFGGFEKNFDAVFSKEINRLFKLAKETIDADPTLDSSKYYGLTDIHEFVSEAFGDPEFRSVLAKMKDPKGKANVIESFIEAIRKFFSDNGIDIETSVLESILAASNRTLATTLTTTDTATENIGKQITISNNRTVKIQETIPIYAGRDNYAIEVLHEGSKYVLVISPDGDITDPSVVKEGADGIPVFKDVKSNHPAIQFTKEDIAAIFSDAKTTTDTTTDSDIERKRKGEDDRSKYPGIVELIKVYTGDKLFFAIDAKGFEVADILSANGITADDVFNIRNTVGGKIGDWFKRGFEHITGKTYEEYEAELYGTGAATTTTKNKGKAVIEEIKEHVKTKELTVDKDPDGEEQSTYSDNEGNSYNRVTSTVNPMDEADKKKPVIQSSIKIGTKVDTLVRDFFEEGSTLSSKSAAAILDAYDLGETAMVVRFLEQLEELKKYFKDTGETVVSSGLTLHSETYKVAGTVDLMTYDEAGQLRIYDIKTMRGNKLTGTYEKDPAGISKYDSTAYNKSDRQKHTDQLSAYNLMLKDTYGVEAVALGILPVEVFYGEKNERGFPMPVTKVYTRTEKLDFLPNEDIVKSKKGQKPGYPFIEIQNDYTVFTRAASNNVKASSKKTTVPASTSGEVSIEDILAMEATVENTGSTANKAGAETTDAKSEIDALGAELNDLVLTDNEYADVTFTEDGAASERPFEESGYESQDGATDLSALDEMLGKSTIDTAAKISKRPKVVSKSVSPAIAANISSNLEAAEPGISEEKVKQIYNDYVRLMRRQRPGSEMEFKWFEQVVQNMQVFKYKDTYVFGQYDPNTGTFVVRVQSSPSIKQLFGEAIPAMGNFGVDVLAFVPKEMATAFGKLGYVVSDKGYPYNFHGEDMHKYAVASDSSVLSKVFGKDEKELTEKEIRKYDRAVFASGIENQKNFQLTAVEIDANAVKAANGDLTAILETFLNSFGISVKDISEIQKALNIDSAGFADILSKIAYIKDKENLPEVAGEFIAHMMQYNPLVTEILNQREYKKIKKKSDKLKAVGKLIAEGLRNPQENIKQDDNSLLGKIKKLIAEFLSILGKTDVAKVNRSINAIVSNILQQNRKLITSSEFKPGEYGKPVSQVSVDKALEKDKFGASIIDRLSKLGFMLTGSTALSEQGTILRPEENPLHDIDWVSPFSREETLNKLFAAYPGAEKVRDIIDEKYITDSYLIVPDGYKIANVVLENFVAEDGSDRIVLQSYDVINAKTNKREGTYRLEEKQRTDVITGDPLFTKGSLFKKSVPKTEKVEVSTGVEGKVIDFFTYPSYETSVDAQYESTSTVAKTGETIQLANWKSIFNAKLEFARYKDIWDYNRFTPNENIEFFRAVNGGFNTGKPIKRRAKPKPAKPTKPTLGVITQEEIDEVAQMVPDSVATEVVEDYVTLLEKGVGAVGLFQSGLVQISRKAKSGDGYHEAFHAVFRTMLSKSQQQKLLQEARDMFMPLESDITTLMKRHKISRDKAVDLFYEEQLADEFGVYALNPRAYDFNGKKERQNYFERLLAWINDILGVTGNIERAFKNIKQGNFNKAHNLNLLIETGIVEKVCKGQ